MSTATNLAKAMTAESQLKNAAALQQPPRAGGQLNRQLLGLPRVPAPAPCGDSFRVSAGPAARPMGSSASPQALLRLQQARQHDELRRAGADLARLPDMEWQGRLEVLQKQLPPEAFQVLEQALLDTLQRRLGISAPHGQQLQHTRMGAAMGAQTALQRQEARQRQELRQAGAELARLPAGERQGRLEQLELRLAPRAFEAVLAGMDRALNGTPPPAWLGPGNATGALRL